MGVLTEVLVCQMKENVLIIGGAGFVGSHTADALLDQGYSVAIYDNLSEQVHRGEFPGYLSSEVEFVAGDVRDLESLARAVKSADVIYHLAAAVGVGVYSATPYYLRPPPRAGLLLGYASLGPAEIRRGIEALARLLR